MSTYVFYLENPQTTVGIRAHTQPQAMKQLQVDHPACQILDAHVYPMWGTQPPSTGETICQLES